jgi:hypothetical protein
VESVRASFLWVTGEANFTYLRQGPQSAKAGCAELESITI